MSAYKNTRKKRNPELPDLLYAFCGMATVAMMVMSVLLFATTADAADTTDLVAVRVAPGPATLTGSPEINVSVLYSGDDNANNRIRIEWGEDGTDFSLGDVTSPPHPAPPYSYTITPLDNSKVYQVRVTLSDTDNGPDVIKTYTGQKPYNPLVHNAVATGSGISKWGVGWGTDDAGAQYGEFSCGTCHVRKSGNIKRIRKDWSDAALPDVPAKTNAQTIVFDSTLDGSAQFALDDSTNHASSNRICEACHTRTAYHRYDVSALGATNHQSSNDCVSCHKHQNAFAASGGCSGCHGGSQTGATESNFWPDSADETSDASGSANDAGEHVKHMSVLADKVLGLTLAGLLDDADSANKQLQLCNYCHALPGSDADHMSGDDAEVTRFLRIGDGAIDSATAGTFDYNYTDTATATCSSVDCHNNKTTPASFAWYQGATSSCVMCHSEDGSNSEALIDPTSGLHLYNASYADVEGHDASFDSGSGTCTTCHQDDPSTGHFNSIGDTPATATFNFYNSSTHPSLSTFEVNLGTLSDTTDDTCAADCHTDQGFWYRQWSQDAYFSFDPATYNTANVLPDGCNVCHGTFGSWALGSSHAGTYDGTASTKGSSHNGPDKPGTKCEDCHVFPSVDKHNNGENLITLNDSDGTPALEDQNGINPVYNATNDAWSCEPCHLLEPLPPISNSYAFPNSQAFSAERVTGTYVPSGSCFSGEWTSACHGYIDKDSGIERWWPAADPRMHDDLSKHPGDPVNETHEGMNFGYPNRAGAHHEHNITIGELVCEKRTGTTCTSDPSDGFTDPTDADYNATCKFCHPMTVQAGVLKATNHYDGVVDVYGGYTYDDLSGTGVEKGRGIANSDPASGSWTKYDAIAGDGFIYQLDDPYNPGAGTYPLDTDGEYRQYLYNYRTATDVNHGTCSSIACHSNAPFTPNWYGDDQAPAQITTLRAYTSASDFDADEIAYYNGASHYSIVGLDDDCQDVTPGAALLTWLAPGDNGSFDGTAYEYEVYYSTGVINDANVGSATRGGGAPTVYRQDELQCMIVDGLVPGSNYYFAVRTKDQPKYFDPDDDDIYDKFIEDGNISLVAATTSTVAAHADDVAPVFWGINQTKSHDSGNAVNLSWDAARDHTLPITYLAYWSDYALKTHLANGGSMPVLTKPDQYDGGVYSFGFAEGSPPTPGGTDYYIQASTTTGLGYQVTGLGSGILYNFLVRAEDGSNPSGTANIDKNTVVAMALPTKLPQETENTMMGILSGAGNIVMQADPLNPNWGSVSSGSTALSGTGSVTFIATSQLDGATSRETWVQGISIDLQIENTDRKLPQSFQVQFGYLNGTFTPIGSVVDVGLGRRANRVMKIGLSANAGVVPANTPLAIRFTRTTSSGSTSAINLEWGNATDKGQILLTAQPINHQPSAPVLGSLSRAPGGYIDITWTPSNDGSPPDGGQTMHYDIFGSADDGATWPFVIGTGLTNVDAITGVRWDTVGDGLDRLNGTGIFNCRVRIDASDGYLYETTPGSGTWLSHNSTTSGTISIDNRQDDEAPAAVTISHEEPRPKQGAAFLHWIAVGNDGYNHGTRAAYYDIRFRKTVDGPLSALTWSDAATIQAAGEPVPGFAGTAETFELLNMTPDTAYQTAIVTCDAGPDDVPGNADDNCSGLSNVYTITSGQYYCGICHSTPPDEPDTRGIHRQHGYTLEDCANCHGDGTSPDGNDVTKYDGRHYDGVINIGWAKDASGNHLTLAEIPATTTSGVSVSQNSILIYSDPDGSGGYNSGGPYTGTENTDSGRCMNFIAANANGCHGPFSPQWAPDTGEPNPAEPTCADCHGDKTAARNLDPYGRIWDDNVAGAPSELVKSSPPTANHGGTTTTDRYVGAHEVHLNSSFRFAKGDSCRLCHRDTMELGLHADGNVDVIFDQVADQDDANPAVVDQAWAEVDTKGASCGSMNNMYCHDTGANWAEPGAKCNDCHGMNGLTYDTVSNTSQIGHVMGTMGDVVECTYCHVAGHPQSPDGINPGDPDTLLINNNAAIGINYRSGGIHLKRVYPWGTFDSLAEICWGCHDQNHDGILREADGDISEFETNTRAATGNSPYHLGQLDQANWIGAIWTSGYGKTSSDPFWYKRGYIQSTHTTDPSGTSKVTWNSAQGRYVETVDTVDKIRCSNCHDVHNLNLAPGDTMTGVPYLRGTWMTNPYEEDGAPYNKAYTSRSVMGQVPRGGTAYDELGGYYIDQNNVVPGTGNTTQTAAHYPTSGWTIQSSAGLCVLCHGDNVDEMDQRDDAALDGNVLWLGTNGHSNSALGGTFSAAVNVFDYTHGRPSPVSHNWGGGRPNSQAHWPRQVPDMAYLDQGNFGLAGGGYRGIDANAGRYLPPMVNGFVGSAAQPYAFNAYNWGTTVDGTTTDQMYHQFSCSKCHNPHASRLPKLLITNCLDIRHNTWDDARSSLQNTFTAAALTAVDRGMPAAYYASAQNCHRFDDRRSTTTLRGGWNKVTPWAFDNDETPSEHKGTYTPNYSSRGSN